MAIKQFIDLEKFHEDIKISELNLNEAFMNQASLFAYYSGLHFHAMKQAATCKILRDAIAAKTEQEIRQANTEANNAALNIDPKAKVEKLTEGNIESQVITNSKVMSAAKEYNDANAILTFISNALEALKQRRDMLISLGANAREERKGELSFRHRMEGQVTQSALSGWKNSDWAGNSNSE